MPPNSTAVLLVSTSIALSGQQWIPARNELAQLWRRGAAGPDASQNAAHDAREPKGSLLRTIRWRKTFPHWAAVELHVSPGAALRQFGRSTVSC